MRPSSAPTALSAGTTGMTRRLRPGQMATQRNRRILLINSSNPRGTIAAARQLARAGWLVAVGTADPHGPVSWCRSVHQTFDVPPVERGLDRFVDRINAATLAFAPDLVAAGGDAELFAISAARDRIESTIPLPPDEVVRRVVDKLRLAELARAAGLDAPVTRPATSSAIGSTSLPVVVKSRFHWLPGHARDAPARLEAVVCSSTGDAHTAAAAMTEAGGEPLLQEYVDGAPINCTFVSDATGRLLGLDQQTSPPLLYPPGVGIRVRTKVGPADPWLRDGMTRLLADVGWFGIGAVTFLVGRDGVPRMIDFNGRYPASLGASSAAGTAYMATWASLAVGDDTATPPEPRPGVRFHWLEGDMRRAAKERRGGLVRDFGGALVYAVGADHTIGRWDEPELIARYALRQTRQAVASRFRPGGRVPSA